MDSCCLSLKAGTNLSTLTRGDDGFWGERIRGSLKNSFCVNNGFKNCLRAEKNLRKIKPGVAFSVLTSENTKEALVC